MTECRIEFTSRDIFVVVDGVKVARRGRPRTPQAGTWVTLEPGYVVRNCQVGGEAAIEVEYNGQIVRVH